MYLSCVGCELSAEHDDIECIRTAVKVEIAYRLIVTGQFAASEEVFAEQDKIGGVYCSVAVCIAH